MANVNFCTRHNFAALWLVAFLLSALSIPPFAVAPTPGEETVYCPLTKTFQPVKAKDVKADRNPLDEICAKAGLKQLFAESVFRAAFPVNSRKSIDEFDDLVFDFLRSGKSAFDRLPKSPDAPDGTTVRPSMSILATAETGGKRPPATLPDARFVSPAKINEVVSNPALRSPQNPVRTLDSVSRNINPRSPPFSA
ncbi:MAG: hypothetical protein IPN69_05510 [Acidobacteria bacterium]|nr:hypothetical protein [Acidobacteriota bacterium]MBK8148778.1 hypothetical protein [Acidobacteriota bacterium]MBK8810175.1 hypothetical protein [Acidobacteriota bacterium]